MSIEELQQRDPSDDRPAAEIRAAMDPFPPIPEVPPFPPEPWPLADRPAPGLKM